MAYLVTHIDDDLAAAIDELVRAGVVGSRSDAVRVALHRLVDRHRPDRIGVRVVEGSRAVPQEASEGGWPDDATVRMIADEPW